MFLTLFVAMLEAFCLLDRRNLLLLPLHSRPDKQLYQQNDLNYQYLLTAK